MAKKKKKKIQTSDQLAIAERELAKGNIKQALKHAKACYRKDPSDSVRSLLQSILLSRGKELHRRGMFEPARAAVEELSALGDLPADQQQEVDRLRVLLGANGLSNVDHAALLESDSQLLAKLVDQTVLQGPSPGCPADICKTAESIRAALEAVEANEHARAAESIAPIGRASPFSDWKLFVRGLMAYYDNDSDRMSANWSRLTQGRAAERISQSLMVVSGQRRYRDVPTEIRSHVDQLSRVLDTPLLIDLRRLGRGWQQGDYLSACRDFIRKYAESEQAIVQQVSEMATDRLIAAGDHDGLETLQRIAPRTALDPKFNRAKGLLADAHGSLSDAEDAWVDYAADLETCEALTEKQRSTAIALVYQRLANRFAAMGTAQADREGLFFDRTAHEDCVAAYRDQADCYYLRSQRHDPELRDVYLEYARLLNDMNESKRAAAIYKELGRRFPNDFDALIAIAEHFHQQGEPGEGKRHARRAQQLRPRDDRAATWVWATSIATARQAAMMKQFALARAELDEAEELLGKGRDIHILYSVRASVEFKANNVEAAEKNVQRAVEQFDQPVAGLLAVCANAARCGVSASIRKELNERLKGSLRKKKSSQAAGAIAKLMSAFKVSHIDYPGMKTHFSQVTAYLNGCTRVQWEANDLVAACSFASSATDDERLLRKLTKRGRKLFPKNPYFYFYGGALEMMAGPLDCDEEAAIAGFEQAVELSKTGDTSLDPLHREAASRALALLRHNAAGNPYDDLDDEDDDFDSGDGNEYLDFSGADPEMLEGMFPPEMVKEFKRLGIDIGDVIEAIINGEDPEEFLERHTSSRRGGKARRNSKTRQSAF